MPASRRALVECVVLSVQNNQGGGCVFYPCCRQCFSRIDVPPHDSARCICSRCGSSCLRQQVDYRYRLSMTVARDRRILGMTVFGGCLNALFGIHASGLQSLVEASDKLVELESPLRSALLFKAVEDCFIGRRFIFGIKVTDAENGPLFGRPTSLRDDSSSSARETALQFIANQILVPRGTGQGGHTVVRYYQALLLQRARTERRTGPFVASRPSSATALPPFVPCQRSPSSSFNNTTLPASGLLPTSRRRSLNGEHILSPTPPWQQSLGLITSSAEQEEEGCGTPAGSGERPPDHQTHSNPRALHAAGCSRRGLSQAKRQDTDPGRVPSSSSPSPSSAYRSSSSCRASPPASSSIREANGNTHPAPHAWLSPSQPAATSGTVPLGFGTREGSDDGEQQQQQQAKEHQANNAALSDSGAWEDIFSESLGLFLCEEEDDGDVVVHDGFCQTDGPNLVSLCRGGACGTPLPGHSQQALVASVSQSNSRLMTGTHPLLEITNPVDGRSHGVDLVPPNPSPKTYDGHLGGNKNESLKEGESPSASLSGDVEESPPVGSRDQNGVYDCSADLFNNSSLTPTPRTQRSTDSHVGEAPLLQPTVLYTQISHNKTAALDEDSLAARTQETQRDRSYIADTQQGQNNDAKTAMEDCDHFHCLDFIPPSQSTPLVKRAAHAGLFVPTHVSRASGLLNSQPDRVDSYSSHDVCVTPLRTTTTIRRSNSLRAHLRQTNRAEQSLPFGVNPRKRSQRRSKLSKSSFRRLDHQRSNSKNSVVMAQKGPEAENTGPNLACVVCDETVHDEGLCDDADTLRGHDGGLCDDADTLRGQQTDTHVDYIDVMTTTASKTEQCNKTGGEVNPNGSVGHLADEESEAGYDVSRDLFTDSF